MTHATQNQLSTTGSKPNKRITLEDKFDAAITSKWGGTVGRVARKKRTRREWSKDERQWMVAYVQGTQNGNYFPFGEGKAYWTTMCAEFMEQPRFYVHANFESMKTFIRRCEDPKFM